MIRRTRHVNDIRPENLPFRSEETGRVLDEIIFRSGDSSACDYVQFSPTILSHIRRILANGGTIITDTEMVLESVEPELLQKTRANICCYINDKTVLNEAEQHHMTRAEAAVDVALTREGNKLFVIGTAPAALGRLLLHRKHEPMSNVGVICTINSYAGSLQLKEKLRESEIPFIVTRGKNGGYAAASIVLNSAMEVLTTVLPEPSRIGEIFK